MLLNASGSWGLALLLLLALGLPLQVAVGGLLALGRPLRAVAALFVPLAVLTVGYAGTVAGMDTAIAALTQSADPAWVPWFALDDRARALLPTAFGGGGAALLALPPALGAAWASRRAPAGGAIAGRWLLPGLGLVAAGLVAGAEGLAALRGAGALAIPALGVFPFAFAAAITLRPARRPNLDLEVVGYGALGIASLGLATAAAAIAGWAPAAELGDYSAPFAAVEPLAARTRDSWFVNRVAAVAAVGAFAALLPALLVRDWRRVGPRSGTDVLACGALALVALLTGGWAGARERVLSHHAGAHGTAVLDAMAGYDVPRRAPLPARVLVGPVEAPRWLMQRERGGLEVLPFAGGLDIIGPALLRNDGLMLPPSLPLEELYLALFGSDAGRIALVGCAPASPGLRADIRRDPLLATGRCGAFPLDLRVTTALDAPRVLIVLADGFVDDGGDVIPAAALADLDGRDVVVRGQLDATVGDLVAVVGALAPAARVYLGWGVTLEGGNLPIGVNPGLRIDRSLFAPLDRAEMVEAGSL